MAPGFPGNGADWRPAGKSVFSTAYGRKTSRIWLTAQNGILSEVFYPDLSTPALRELDFAVLNGRGKAERVSTNATHSVRWTHSDAPIATHTSTAKDKTWRLITTYTVDASRTSVLADITFTSLDRRPRTLVALADPSLNNDGNDDVGAATRTTASAWEFDAAVTMQASTPFSRTSIGFVGVSDGWSDVWRDGRVDWTYTSTDSLAGNVALTGVLNVNGIGKKRALIVLGFGESLTQSRRNAAATVAAGSAQTLQGVRATWQKYLKSLPQPPSSLTSPRQLLAYRTSQMMLAASEDKSNAGAFIASPSTPWAWGTDSALSAGMHGYRLVWGRDAYQVGTALLAMGDRAAAIRLVRYLFEVQSYNNGGMPQNSHVDGTPMANGVQLDQVTLPIVLAWQLAVNRGGEWVALTDSGLWGLIKAAADYTVAWKRDDLTAPATGAERWEERAGYSPSTIAATIAGLVCAAAFARKHGDSASATKYEVTARSWASSVKSWTLTTSGELAGGTPYFIRLSRTGDPNAGTPLDTGNGGPTVDERTVVDAGFLELVRLGVLPANDADVRTSLRVVDENISVRIGSHRYYYRYNHDGYGEGPSGQPWSGDEGGAGRLWPLLSGERGEYELLAGRMSAAKRRLAAMSAASTALGLLPEQIWDANPPASLRSAVYRTGRATDSATPLAWTHAQFVRLAWSITVGKPVEYPRIVACVIRNVC